MMQRTTIAIATLCACGPVQGVADDTGSGGDTYASSPSEPASVTAATTMPQQEVTTVGEVSYDAVSFEVGPVDEGPIDDGIKIDEYVQPPCSQSYDVYPAYNGVALLIDASQTMVTGLVDHDDDVNTPEITRWAMVTNALVEHVPGLVQHSVVGIWSFPSFTADAPPSDQACAIAPTYEPIGSGSDQILQYLPPVDATFMQGATPTWSAIASAASELSTLTAASHGYLIVLTDSAPNCDPDLTAPDLFDQLDTNAYDWAAYAASADMEVRVIGIAVPSGTWGGGGLGDASTDHRAALSLLAQTGGGTAIFADDAAVLDLALTAIADETVSCRLEVPGAIAGGYYHVIIDRDRYYYELPPELCADNSGFVRLQDAGIEVIEMCAAACDSLRLHGVAVIEEECPVPE
jgi:hypothetical protein